MESPVPIRVSVGSPLSPSQSPEQPCESAEDRADRLDHWLQQAAQYGEELLVSNHALTKELSSAQQLASDEGDLLRRELGEWKARCLELADHKKKLQMQVAGLKAQAQEYGFEPKHTPAVDSDSCSSGCSHSSMGFVPQVTARDSMSTHSERLGRIRGPGRTTRFDSTHTRGRTRYVSVILDENTDLVSRIKSLEMERAHLMFELDKTQKISRMVLAGASRAPRAVRFSDMRSSQISELSGKDFSESLSLRRRSGSWSLSPGAFTSLKRRDEVAELVENLQSEQSAASEMKRELLDERERSWELSEEMKENQDRSTASTATSNWQSAVKMQTQRNRLEVQLSEQEARAESLTGELQVFKELLEGHELTLADEMAIASPSLSPTSSHALLPRASHAVSSTASVADRDSFASSVPPMPKGARHRASTAWTMYGAPPALQQAAHSVVDEVVAHEIERLFVAISQLEERAGSTSSQLELSGAAAARVRATDRDRGRLKNYTEELAAALRKAELEAAAATAELCAERREAAAAEGQSRAEAAELQNLRAEQAELLGAKELLEAERNDKARFSASLQRLALDRGCGRCSEALQVRNRLQEDLQRLEKEKQQMAWTLARVTKFFQHV